MGCGFYQQTLLWQIKKVKENTVSSTPFLFQCSSIRSKGSNYWDALQLIKSPLLLQYLELSTSCKVLTRLLTEGCQTDEASLNWCGEEDSLFLSIVLKLTFSNSFAPCLTVVANLNAVLLDVTIVAVLTWKVGETLDSLHSTTVEVNPVWVVSHSNRIHCVPVTAWISISKVACITLTTLLT